MNSEIDRINLKKLVDDIHCDNNTEKIRTLKHSVKIRDDIREIGNLRSKFESMYTTDRPAFIEMCKINCIFLYNNYTDIFHKICNDDIDLVIMTKILTVLKLIEDEKVDQHEGSAIVGNLLKELYIDSAIKHANHLDNLHDTPTETPVEGKCISWKEYKKKYSDI